MNKKIKAITPYNIDFNSPQYNNIISSLESKPKSQMSTPEPFMLPQTGDEIVEKLLQIPEINSVLIAMNNEIKLIKEKINELSQGSGGNMENYQNQINDINKDIGELREKIKTSNEKFDEIINKFENVLILPTPSSEYEEGYFGVYLDDGKWKLGRVAPYGGR